MPYLHTHIEYEILFIRSGKVMVESNCHVLSLEGPSLVIHKPFMLHRAYTESEERYERYIANFDSRFVENFSPWIPAISEILPETSCCVKLDRALSDMLTENFMSLWQCYLDGNDSRCELLLALLLDRFTYAIGKERVMVPHDEHTYIRDVMDYISCHFEENLLAEELARHFYVSRAKLASDFKSYTNLTIKQYILLTRINFSKQQLKAGKSVSDTAQRCGFCDDSHFIHTFRTLVGMTPGEYISDRMIR
jgi:AraC-like DNA-binding protein